MWPLYSKHDNRSAGIQHTLKSVSNGKIISFSNTHHSIFHGFFLFIEPDILSWIQPNALAIFSTKIEYNSKPKKYKQQRNYVGLVILLAITKWINKGDEILNLCNEGLVM